MPLMMVSVARSLLPEFATTVMTGSVVRSAAISPVVHVESEEGGPSGTDGRPVLDGEVEAGMDDSTGALPTGSGTGTEGTAGASGSGTVRIFCVLKGSFIGQGRLAG